MIRETSRLSTSRPRARDDGRTHATGSVPRDSRALRSGPERPVPVTKPGIVTAVSREPDPNERECALERPGLTDCNLHATPVGVAIKSGITTSEFRVVKCVPVHVRRGQPLSECVRARGGSAVPDPLRSPVPWAMYVGYGRKERAIKPLKMDMTAVIQRGRAATSSRALVRSCSTPRSCAELR